MTGSHSAMQRREAAGSHLRDVRRHRRPGEAQDPAGPVSPRGRRAPPKNYRVIGCSRQASAISDKEFRKRAYDAVCEFGTNKPEGAEWEEFEKNLSFAYAEEDGTGELVDAVARAEKEMGGEVQRLFHLAVPPNALLGIIEMLGATGLNVNTKIICEKPFGTDLASAAN